MQAAQTTNSTEVLKNSGECDVIEFTGCPSATQSDIMGVQFKLTYEGGEPKMCDGAPVWGYSDIAGGRSLYTMEGENGSQWFVGTQQYQCMPQKQWLIRSNGDGSTYIYMAFAEMPTKYANAR